MSWTREFKKEGFGDILDSVPVSPGADQVITREFRVVTPIIGGGAEAGKIDIDDPIRTSSIVGAVRDVFRKYLYSLVPPEQAKQFESTLFGTAETDALVKVVVQLRKQDASVTTHTASGKCPPSIPSYVGQILLQGGSTFTYSTLTTSVVISLDCSDTSGKIWEFCNTHLRNVIDLLPILGGVGARVSRGCGTLSPINGIKAERLRTLFRAQAPATADAYESIKGAQVFLRTPKEDTAASAWFLAVNAYNALSRGLQTDAVVDHLNRLRPTENLWEGRGPTEPDLRHTLWKDEKVTVQEGKRKDKVYAPRANFGLPRSYGHRNPSLNFAVPGSAPNTGRRQSPIITRPIQVVDEKGNARWHAMIIVLQGDPVKSSDLELIDSYGNHPPFDISIRPDSDLIDVNFEQADEFSLGELCSEYFNDLKFKEITAR